MRKRMFAKRRRASALPLMLLLVGGGCGSLRSYERQGPGLFHHHRRASKVSRQNVIVGGRVHQPAEIEIGPEGLSLRTALARVGGVRESAFVSTPPTNGTVIDRRIHQLVFFHREIGRYDFIENVYQMLTAPEHQQFEDIVGLSRDNVAEARQRVTAEADTLLREIVATASRLSQPKLDQLVEASDSSGQRREQLRLFEHQLVRRTLKTKREDLEKLVVEEDKEVEDIINELGGSQTRPVLTAVGQTTSLVALERSTDAGPVTYYFPYSLATSSEAGDIYLEANDVVQVLDIRDTTLNPALSIASTARRSVVLRGMLNNPRIAEDVRSIGQLPTSAEPSINDTRAVWMLTRPSAGGLGQDVFVLTSNFVQQDGAAAASLTRDGDVFTYTILPQVPIVLQSLTETALGVRQLRAARERRTANRGKLAQWHQRADEKMTDHIAQTSGLKRHVLRNMQAFKRIFRARTQGIQQ